MSRSRVGVVGAGIVGLAVARQIQLSLGAEVTVLEKEAVVGAHQTGHNSNVVHSGVYYTPGSLKALLCRRGAHLLREYCRGRALPYEELGKVIVAVNDDELPRLEALARRAVENGIPDTRLLSDEELREREPHVSGKAALLIPSTAVTSYPEVARSLAAEIEYAGGEIRLSQAVVAIAPSSRGVRIATERGEFAFDHLVICAGLHSASLAKLARAPAEPAIVPFRGEYYELAEIRGNLVRGLVYPVPDPRYPFLGVHFTRGIDGHVHVGPNAVLALALEGYRWRDLDVRDIWRSLTYPGSRRLAAQHWRTGIKELTGSVSKLVYLRRARMFIPELSADDLVPATAGVRAQAIARDGKLVDDFAINQMGPVTLVRNAPSPAATASLAIAEHIVAALPDIGPQARAPAQ
jgi:L-2-hydroxyglutarate oxidase LhgO